MKVTREEILVVLKNAGLSADLTNIKGDTPFRKLGIDSLDMMTILLSIEEQYKIKISDEDAATLNSVDKIVVYLQIR